MGNDRSPMNVGDQLMAVCVSVFAGALALNLAVHLLAQIWVQLLVAGIVIALVTAGILIYRWRRDHW